MFFDAFSGFFVTRSYGNPNRSLRIIGLPTLLLLWVAAPIGAAETWNLVEDLSGGYRHVRTELKVDGTMRINPDGKKLRHYPMGLTGRYEATERIFNPTRSVRYYHRAETETQADQQTLTDELPSLKRLIAVDTGSGSPVLFSPGYTLTRHELELIQVPGNPLVLSGLLPDDAVELNQPWSPSNQALAQVLGIDAVHSHEVQGVLNEVNQEGVAKVTVQGKVSGAIEGVATEIELKSRIDFDTQARQVTWFAASIKEDRSIGHAAPGFEVTAIVRTQLAPTEAIDQLSDDKLAEVDLTLSEGRKMLAFESTEAGFRLMHDRRWFVVAETPKLTVFRRVLDGELIAQANVTRLTDLKPGEQMTLEGFQAEVKKALGERLAQIVDASQAINSQGLREMRVSAVGTANSLPITWIYYLVSDDSGRRYATIFTLETNLAETFAEADRSLMSGFNLIELPRPTPSTSARVTEDESSLQPTVLQAVTDQPTRR